MSRLQVALGLTLIAFVGFLRLRLHLGQEIKRKKFALDFLEQLQKLAHGLPGLDNDTYSWLTQRSARMQYEMGRFGTLTYRPAFESHLIQNYPLIVNTLAGLRTGLRGSVDLIMSEDALLRYIGVLDDEFGTLRNSIVNPLVWLREGTSFFLATPLYVLQALGLAAASFVMLVINSRIFQAVAGLVTLIGLVSSLVTITLGWNQFLKVVNGMFRPSARYSTSPGSSARKTSPAKPPTLQLAPAAPNHQPSQPPPLRDDGPAKPGRPPLDPRVPPLERGRGILPKQYPPPAAPRRPVPKEGVAGGPRVGLGREADGVVGESR